MTLRFLKASQRVWRRREIYRYRMFSKARTNRDGPRMLKWEHLYQVAKAQRQRRDRQISERIMAHPTDISARGLRFIKGFEGFFPDQYDDGTGVVTIGYGTTAADVSPLPHHVTKAQAAKLLRDHLEAKYLPAVRALNLPTQGMFDAVASAAYNLGEGILTPAHDLGRLLHARQWKAAADSLLEYTNPGTNVTAGLLRRRKAERRIFLSKRWPKPLARPVLHP